MKKNKGLLIVLLLIIAISVAGFFITFGVNRVQTIKASMFDLSAQVSYFQKWKKWNPALVNAGDSILNTTPGDKKQHQTAIKNDQAVAKLTVINPAMFQLQQGNGPMQTITLLPTEKEDVTGVLWTSKISGFQWLTSIVFGSDEIMNELNQLKKFAESTQGIYGFPIEVCKVSDLIICTKKETIPPGDLQPYITGLLSDIRQFLKVNKMSADKDYYYVSSSSLIGGKLELAVGIPVKSEIPPARGFEFLKLPAGGNLLVGTCKGNPAEIQKLYAAMNKYVQDKRLSKVAQSMEKYTGDPARLKTKGIINMQLIYPIY